MARPKVKIDMGELEKLCGLQCTNDEIAAFLGVSSRTIERRRRVEKFRTVMDNAYAKGRISIRRALFKMAGQGNVAAAIFLSKNLLGYKDVVNNELTGAGGGPIQMSSKPDLSQLTKEELAQLRVIAEKTKPAARD